MRIDIADSGRLLGWRPRYGFEETIAATVRGRQPRLLTAASAWEQARRMAGDGSTATGGSARIAGGLAARGRGREVFRGVAPGRGTLGRGSLWRVAFTRWLALGTLRHRRTSAKIDIGSQRADRTPRFIAVGPRLHHAWPKTNQHRSRSV